MAFNFQAFFEWSENLETRRQSLEHFADSAGAMIQQGCAAWGDGLYLILHFDLLTVGVNGQHLNRNDVYEAVENCVHSNHGTRLGGSVYIVPLLPHQGSEKCAAMFWNTLRDMLADHLVPGDSFYLHYAPDFRNLMGGIAQVVPDGAAALTFAIVPDA